MHFKFIESICGSVEPSSAKTEAAQLSSVHRNNNNKQPNKHPANLERFFSNQIYLKCEQVRGKTDQLIHSQKG